MVPSSLIKSFSPQSEIIANAIQSSYTLGKLVEIESLISDAMDIELSELGHVCASSRAVEGTDPTHYDAVWVRDSVWVYFALAQCDETAEAAKLVLSGLRDYFACPKQRERLERVSKNPSLATGPNGAMEVIHIRFDGTSPSFEDVQVGGKDQVWNHKQSDALGLFYYAVGEALLKGWLPVEEVTEEQWSFLLSLPKYWDAIGYESHEDAGAWEEIERINTSSVGLVLRSLEIWDDVSTRIVEIPWLGDQTAQSFQSLLSTLIDRGYDRLNKQIPFESPCYPKESPKYREADAALLCLLYPDGLKRLTVENKRALLSTVSRLVRERGVIRYERDAYQSGNYWLNDSSGSELDSRTDDHSTEGAFASREAKLIPGTEAEWFFDSWVSLAYGNLYQECGEEEDLTLQVAHFNRALCQLTGENAIGADGNVVEDFSLPESYNTIIQNGDRVYAPSPITPLNWSKACLALALRSLRTSLQLKTQ